MTSVEKHELLSHESSSHQYVAYKNVFSYKKYVTEISAVSTWLSSTTYRFGSQTAHRPGAAGLAIARNTRNKLQKHLSVAAFYAEMIAAWVEPLEMNAVSDF